MRKVLYLILSIVFIATVAYSASQGVPKHIIFSGLNTDSGPLGLSDGDSPDCMNVHSDIFGTLLKRAGYTKLSSTTHAHITTSPGKCNGLYDYAINADTRKLVGYFDNFFYKMDSLDGNFAKINFTTAMSNNVAEFLNFDGRLIISTWSRNLAQSWNGTDVSTSDVTNMPKGKFIIQAYNRIFVADIDVGGEIFPLRFYFSNSGSYTTWTIASDYETFDAGAGDRSMGWGLLKGRLVGFTKYTVSIVSDVGGGDPIQVTKRIDGTGCGAPRTIKTVNSPAMGESLIWLTNDKRLVIWNGSTLKDISEKVYSSNGLCPFSMDSIYDAQMEYAHAQVDEANGWYVIWIPIGTTIDYCLKYDYKSGALWPAGNQNFFSSAIVATSSGNVIYTGEEDGEVQRWEYGASDDGESINSYWTSRKWDFGFSPYLKKMGEVQVITKTIGNYPLYYQTRYNWTTGWSTQEEMTMVTGGDWLLGQNLPAILGGHYAQVHRWTIPYAFNLFQIKMSDNSSNPRFQVFSLDLATNTTGAIE